MKAKNQYFQKFIIFTSLGKESLSKDWETIGSLNKSEEVEQTSFANLGISTASQAGFLLPGPLIRIYSLLWVLSILSWQRPEMLLKASWASGLRGASLLLAKEAGLRAAPGKPFSFAYKTPVDLSKVWSAGSFHRGCFPGFTPPSLHPIFVAWSPFSCFPLPFQIKWFSFFWLTPPS